MFELVMDGPDAARSAAGSLHGLKPLLHRLLTCADKDEAEDVAGHLAQALGFSFFSYVISTFSLGDDGHGAAGLFLTSYPREWRDRYNRRSYGAEDPVLVEGRHQRSPFAWGGEPHIRAMDPKARRIFMEAQDFGIHSGVTVPVHGPRGDCGLFSVSGPDLRSDIGVGSLAYANLLVVAHLLHTHVMSLRARACAEPDVTLTRHERDCLSWTAQGKTAWEVAQILGRSKATVEFHLRRASDKLSATNKVHAVTRALRLNLI